MQASLLLPHTRLAPVGTVLSTAVCEFEGVARRDTRDFLGNESAWNLKSVRSKYAYKVIHVCTIEKNTSISQAGSCHMIRIWPDVWPRLCSCASYGTLAFPEWYAYGVLVSRSDSAFYWVLASRDCPLHRQAFRAGGGNIFALQIPPSLGGVWCQGRAESTVWWKWSFRTA